MNHFDYYSIKLLECSQEQLIEIIKKKQKVIPVTLEEKKIK